MRFNLRSTTVCKINRSLRKSKAAKTSHCCCLCKSTLTSPSSSESPSTSAATRPVLRRRKKLLPGEYLVEKILAYQVVNEEVQYFVKWTGYPSTFNSWVPEGNLFKCSGLIAQFQKRLDGDPPLKPKEETSHLLQQTTKTEESPRNSGENGLSRGQSGPEKILGTTQQNGERCFLVKYNQDSQRSRSAVVKVEEAKNKWPELVIRFYENRFLLGGYVKLLEMLGKDELMKTNSTNCGMIGKRKENK